LDPGSFWKWGEDNCGTTTRCSCYWFLSSASKQCWKSPPLCTAANTLWSHLLSVSQFMGIIVQISIQRERKDLIEEPLPPSFCLLLGNGILVGFELAFTNNSPECTATSKIAVCSPTRHKRNLNLFPFCRIWKISQRKHSSSLFAFTFSFSL
jgi:hypothetical protein